MQRLVKRNYALNDLISAQGSGTTYQTGADTIVRGYFAAQGTLDNTEDTSFRAISDDWPVFAFAEDLGTVTSTATSAQVFSIGHFRDPAIEYIIANGELQSRSAYFLSQYSTVADAVRMSILPMFRRIDGFDCCVDQLFPQ